VVAHKGSPALERDTARPPAVQTRGHVFTNSPGRHLEAHLEQEFVGDLLLASCRVLPGYMTDEHSQVRRQSRASQSGFPAPEELEPLPMPTDQGLWLHDHQRLAPVEPTTEPHQGDTSGLGRTPRLDVPFAVERELFAEEEVFCRECRGRA
jgi:hypothetical protein